jgi:hypothetical protein
MARRLPSLAAVNGGICFRDSAARHAFPKSPWRLRPMVFGSAPPRSDQSNLITFAVFECLHCHSILDINCDSIESIARKMREQTVRNGCCCACAWFDFTLPSRTADANAY